MLARASYYPPGGQDWFQKVVDAIAAGGQVDQGNPALGSGGTTHYVPGGGTVPAFFLWRFPGNDGAICVIRGIDQNSQGVEALLGSFLETFAPYPGAVHHIWRQYAETILGVLQSQYSWFLDGPMYFLGHSLGGAVGLLAATKIFKEPIGAGQVKVVLSLGSPTPGDVGFAASNFGRGGSDYFPYFRYREPTDPITYLPFWDTNLLTKGVFGSIPVNTSLRAMQPVVAVGAGVENRKWVNKLLPSPREDVLSTTFISKLYRRELDLRNHSPKQYAGACRLTAREAIMRGNAYSSMDLLGVCNIRYLVTLCNQLDTIEV